MEFEEDEDLEFEAFVKEFAIDISAAEYANFAEKIPASESTIHEFEINWRQRVREDKLMWFKIQKLQVIRLKRFAIMTGAMTKMTSWNKKT